MERKFLGHFIAGKFHLSEDPNGEWENFCPGDLEHKLGTFPYGYEDVHKSVEAAQESFPSWRRTSLEDRLSFLKKYQENIKTKKADLAKTISLEMGKPLWEAETEVDAMVGKIDITISEGLKQVQDFRIENIQPGTIGECRFRPLGVMAVIGPFNFPGHLPNGHIVPALLTGNTVIFKPSEKTPLTGQMMAEAFAEAGLPNGVFNLLQGDKEVGRRLTVHEGVDGVLFTGSYEVGTRIKQETLQQHWKLLALEMGGKNSTVICADANYDAALRESFLSAFLTTGQRCTSSSRIFVHKDHFEKFVSDFHQKAKSFEIGHPLENPFMGPLADATALDRYLKFLAIVQRDGFELVMRGKPFEAKHKGHYVTPTVGAATEMSLESAKKSIFQQTEIFAPMVGIVQFESLDEVIPLVNSTQYGLASSIFTQTREQYLKYHDEVHAGVINWNRSTVGASSRLPFGGFKKSGNHRPTGVFASQYCMNPVSSLEVGDPSSEAPKSPGLNWE